MLPKFPSPPKHSAKLLSFRVYASKDSVDLSVEIFLKTWKLGSVCRRATSIAKWQGVPMLVATPIHPPSFTTQHSSEDSYRPSQDFKSLLAPIEFVEGSSTGGLAVPEGRYEPINGTPKALKAIVRFTQSCKCRLSANRSLQSTISTPPGSSKIVNPTKSSAAPSPNGKTASLYTGALDTTWPPNSTTGTGLYNTGNSCFLNSALQCLLHTPPLVRVLAEHGRGDSCTFIYL